MNAEQQVRLGKLLAMGIPLPVALPLAMDPNAKDTVATGLIQTEKTIRNAIPKAKKVKRKVSAYNRKYKAAFKRVSKKYKKKNGEWKKGGFKSAVRAAHKEAGGKK